MFILNNKLKSVKKYLLYFTCIIFFLSIYAQALLPAKNKDKDKKLNQTIKKLIKKSNISTSYLGIMIADSKNILYQLNSHKSFIPASLIKIFTASALLDLLSPSLQFNTQFLAINKIKNNILPGDLYLKGGGDPGFVSESLWNLVNHLKRNKIKIIKGDLIVDSHKFDNQKKGERLVVPSHASYDAPVGALSFNWNTANIYLRPAQKIGNRLQINIDPSALYFKSITNNTKTIKQNKTKNILIHRQKQKQHKESLHIKGELFIKHPEVLIYKNILYPALWTGWNAISFLKQRGITLIGTVKTGITPPNAVVLAELKSHHLIKHIKSMMKYSNNFMVEMLVKNMVVELKNKQGNLKDGLKIIKKHIQKIGISPKKYSLVQASGLSRKNKITTQQLLKVLKYWSTHKLQPEFESALPLSGEDGTLKTYFKHSKLKGYIHAKTGNLNGVLGLAGYLITKTGEKRIFIFLFNGPHKLKAKTNNLFKKIASAIWKN